MTGRLIGPLRPARTHSHMVVVHHGRARFHRLGSIVARLTVRMAVMAGRPGIGGNVMLVRGCGRRRLRNSLWSGWHRSMIVRLGIRRARQNERADG